MSNQPVLLLGLFDTSIMTARCFKNCKIDLYGMDYEYSNSGFYSRRIDSIKMPSTSNVEKWLDFLIGWLKKTGKKYVLIPASDEFVLLSSKYKDIINNYTFSLLPDYKVICRISERDKQFDYALKYGMQVPSYILGPITTVSQINLKYPLAIKPCNPLEWKKFFNNKGFMANNQAELQNSIDLVNKYPIDYIVQEIITGEVNNNYEINSLLLPNGQYFYHTIRKIRQYPYELGTATCIESASNRYLEESVETFVREMGLVGFSNIEFKFDQKTGNYYYIETNPRVWLQINFTAALGLNFPQIYYNYLIGKPQDQIHRTTRKQGKWVDPAPDLLYFFRYRKIKKIKIIRWLLDLYPIKSVGLFSLSDPYPIFKEYRFGLRLFKSRIIKN